MGVSVGRECALSIARNGGSSGASRTMYSSPSVYEPGTRVLSAEGTRGCRGCGPGPPSFRSSGFAAWGHGAQGAATKGGGCPGHLAELSPGFREVGEQPAAGRAGRWALGTGGPPAVGSFVPLALLPDRPTFFFFLFF